MLRHCCNKAFISDASPVPFVVNNDGTLSLRQELDLDAQDVTERDRYETRSLDHLKVRLVPQPY